jgi:hypothetical protein
MAVELEMLNRLPHLAAEDERVASETTASIEVAAKTAGIRPEALVRITPAMPQRLGDTVYKEKPTHIQLRNVTLAQVVRMMHAAVTSPQRLQPRSLRITAPERDDNGETWNAEIVVAYLIYEPLHTETKRSPR